MTGETMELLMYRYVIRNTRHYRIIMLTVELRHMPIDESPIHLSEMHTSFVLV